MDEIPRERLMTWRIIRTHFVRIVIGMAVVSAVFAALCIYMPYQREQQIAQRIKSLGGEVELEYMGPDWIPQLMHAGLPFLRRINAVTVRSDSEPLFSEIGMSGFNVINFRGPNLTDAGMQHIERLTHVTDLAVGGDTKVTDVGLKHLMGLPRLKCLILGGTGTQVTDASLEHLKGLTTLELLFLHQAQVTDAGLEHLKGLVNLRWLILVDTKSTPEGRAMLQKALPNCKIDPSP